MARYSEKYVMDYLMKTYPHGIGPVAAWDLLIDTGAIWHDPTTMVVVVNDRHPVGQRLIEELEQQ